MDVEGVHFIESAIKKISRDKFVKLNIGVFFLDRNEKKREEILEDIYNRITGKKL